MTRVTLTFNKKWSVKEKPERTQLQQLAETMNASPLFIQLCLQRGLNTQEKIDQFLNPDENYFHDPFLMHDMQKACERIMLAIEQGELITVYGDYDADGVTSTAIVIETLEMMGAQTNFFIPNRFKEGYGPNKNAFEQLIENGTKLIITVDNGVAGHEAIQFAQEHEVDVIVSDHHELPEKLPKAFAIVHPKHPAGNYPFGELSGAGVALKIAAALLGELPVELLDIATIGTVADLVSLTDENRAIVAFGLKMIKKTQRLGLLSLMRECDLALDEIDETSIGFKLGPRLNAIGRLGDAGPAVELLTTFDEERAQELASFIHNKNEERKEIVSRIVDEALDQVNEHDPSQSVYVLAKEGWHEGVLGIVASRIINETGKPTIVLNINPETGEAKGSGRSIQAFNLYESCNEMRELFVQFGGHHMAAGMTLSIENIDRLRENLNEKAASMQETVVFTDEIEVDIACSITDITLKSLTEINQLKPFGTGNLKPIFQLKDVNVLEAKRIGADKSHLKFKVQQEQSDLDIIAFNFGEITDALKGNPSLSLVGEVGINEWNGNRKPQFMLSDLKINGPIVFDKRSTNLTKDIFTFKNTHYVFFREKLFEKLVSEIPVSSQATLIHSVEDAQAFQADQAIVYVDCPQSIDLFKETFLGNEKQIMYCSFFSNGKGYMIGMPSREQFTTLYKFFAAHKNINLKEQGRQLAKHLQLDVDILKFMIKVFLDAEFVTIEDEVLNMEVQPEKKDIFETKTYILRQESIKAEELLLYSSFKELTATLQSWTSMSTQRELKENM